MKITDVEPIYLRLPEVDATRSDGTQDTLVVLVHTDEGLTGVGEVDSAPLVAKAAIDALPSHLLATGLRSLLIGENPAAIELLWDRMYEGTSYFGRSGPAMHAISGVDMALWDLRGKMIGAPVAELMGGPWRRELLGYASDLMPDLPEVAGRLAEEYVARGYRAVKFGWGPLGRDARLDSELLHAIRTAVGDEVLVMIDGGQAWNYKGALRMARLCEEYDVYWLEEPLAPDDLDGYRRLADQTTVRIAAGEQESGHRAFGRLLDEGRVDILQPDLGRCGGLTEGRRIADLARDRSADLVPHAFKTGILLAASVHFAAAIRNAPMVEHTVSSSPLARHLVTEPIEFRDGNLVVPTERSGLGVELNTAVVDRYRVR